MDSPERTTSTGIPGAPIKQPMGTSYDTSEGTNLGFGGGRRRRTMRRSRSRSRSMGRTRMGGKKRKSKRTKRR
jgi:hypothetical protein